MRTLSIPCFLALSLVAPAAYAHDEGRADDPWYIQFGLGVVSAAETDALDTTNATVSVGFDPGAAVSFAIGRDMGGGDRFGWAIEGEMLWTRFNLDEGDLVNFTTQSKGAGATAFFGNLVLDYHVSDDVAWYLGGGVGYAPSIDYETFDSGSLVQVDQDAIAGQVKTGLNYRLGELTNVLVGYRYFATEDIGIAQGNVPLDTSFQNHILEVAMRWGF